jgi:hypothetical protein
MAGPQDEPTDTGVEDKPAPGTDSTPSSVWHLIPILAVKGFKAGHRALKHYKRKHRKPSYRVDIPDSKRCVNVPDCGKEIPAKSKYCPCCGTRQPET